MQGNSVQRKVIAQINAINANGVVCEGLFLSTDEISNSNDSPLIHRVKVPKVQSRFFKSSKQRTAYFNALLLQDIVQLSNYDAIYIRYPGAHALFKSWLIKEKKFAFFEHVTAETEEIKIYKKEHPFVFNLSSLLSYIEFYYSPLLREKIYGKSIRRAAAFGICNSEEIAEYETQMAAGKYQTLILGDAVQTKDYPMRNHLELNQEFKFIFLKGANTAADFNGLDRVLHGIKNYKGSIQLKFYLYGKNLDNEKNLIQQLGIQSSVECHGFISHDKIDELMQDMHLGIGALAVHRKGIKSTSTIKTREYFARGLPFVYGHHDPDFSNQLVKGKFCLELEADDSAIDFTHIINWYKSQNFSQSSINDMHQYALNNLDYQVKMKKLLTYLTQKLNHQIHV